MPLPKQHTYTSEDYWNLPDSQRAELIDGQLYNMAPPVGCTRKFYPPCTGKSALTSRNTAALARSIPPHLPSIWMQTIKTGLNRISPLSVTTTSSQIGAAPVLRTGSWKLYRRPAAGWITPSKTRSIPVQASGNTGSSILRSNVPPCTITKKMQLR